MRQSTFFALILTLGLGLSGLASAQDRGWGHDRDDDYRWNRNGAYASNDRGYRDGLAQGQADRSSNRRFNYENRDFRRGDSSYRESYRAGYERGYNSGNYGYRGQYPNGYPSGRDYPYGNNYPYGNGYPAGRNGGYGNMAFSQGQRDGQLDGEKDLRTGHSYRPTEGNNYKHADRGYDSSFGDKNAYKQEYRSGYVNGYEQGYRRR